MAFDLFNKKNLLILILILVVVYLVSGQMSSHSKLKDYKNQMLKFDLKEQKYIETIDDNGNKIIEQEQIILTQKDAIAHNLLEITDLKKINSQISVTTITRIDSVFIPVIDTINRVIYDTTGIAFLELPTEFSVRNNYYSLNTTIKSTGMMIDSLYLYNKQVITLGMKSNGVFRKPTPTVLITNDNPYVQVSGLNNIVIKEDLRFYDKKKFWFYTGLGIGIIAPIILIK